MTAVLKAADLGVRLPVLPLNRDYDPRYGEAVAISPLVRRVLAPNPGPFTFHGTGTYIVGHGRVAVIDPGPLLAAHVEALCRALDGETVSHILVTHTHNDHSPAAACDRRADLCLRAPRRRQAQRRHRRGGGR